MLIMSSRKLFHHGLLNRSFKSMQISFRKLVSQVVLTTTVPWICKWKSCLLLYILKRLAYEFCLHSNRCIHSSFVILQELGALCTMAGIQNHSSCKVNSREQRYRFWIHQRVYTRRCYHHPRPRHRSNCSWWTPFYPTREGWRSVKWNPFLHSQTFCRLAELLGIQSTACIVSCWNLYEYWLWIFKQN